MYSWEKSVVEVILHDLSHQVERTRLRRHLGMAAMLACCEKEAGDLY